MSPWLPSLLEGLELTILALYFGILGVLALYGLHRLALVFGYWRLGRRDAPPPAEPEDWPRVTVQLPIFDERWVAERLIDAVCALDYPRDRLEIQVLDDSTDETREIAANRAAYWREKGVDIHHLHRTERTGYKAGALAAGHAVAKGEILTVFDADFVPPADFLRRTVPHFSDPDVGMVQARWGHLNRDYSLLTRVQAILLDGHFVVEHTVRSRTGHLFNFNGTAGLWRRRAIEDAGGWEHDTLTEDLDLSYRAQLAGWRFVYRPDVVVPAELPAEINAYKSQQHRWTKGSVQTARKLLGRVLRSPLPWRTKLEAFIHLTANGTYLLMLGLSLLIFPAMALRRDEPSWWLWAFDLPLFAAATVSVILFFLVSQRREGGASFGRTLLDLPALMAVGIGLSVNNARAVLEGFTSDGGVFHRTPKFRLEGRDGGVTGKGYALGRGLALWLETGLAVYFVACFALAIHLGLWGSLPFLWLFLQGYVTLAWLGHASSLRRRRPPLRPATA